MGRTLPPILRLGEGRPLTGHISLMLEDVQSAIIAQQDPWQDRPRTASRNTGPRIMRFYIVSEDDISGSES